MEIFCLHPAVANSVERRLLANHEQQQLASAPARPSHCFPALLGPCDSVTLGSFLNPALHAIFLSSRTLREANMSSTSNLFCYSRHRCSGSNCITDSHVYIFSSEFQFVHPSEIKVQLEYYVPMYG